MIGAEPATVPCGICEMGEPSGMVSKQGQRIIAVCESCWTAARRRQLDLAAPEWALALTVDVHRLVDKVDVIERKLRLTMSTLREIARSGDRVRS